MGATASGPSGRPVRIAVLSLPLIARLIRSTAYVQALTQCRKQTFHPDNSWFARTIVANISEQAPGRWSMTGVEDDSGPAFESRVRGEADRLEQLFTDMFEESLDNPDATIACLEFFYRRREERWALYDAQNREASRLNNVVMERHRVLYNRLCAARLGLTIAVVAIPALMLAMPTGGASLLIGLDWAATETAAAATIAGLAKVGFAYSVASAGVTGAQEGGPLDSIGGMAVEVAKEGASTTLELMHKLGAWSTAEYERRIARLQAEAYGRSGQVAKAMIKDYERANVGGRKFTRLTGVGARFLPLVFAAQDVVEDYQRLEP